MTGSVTGDGRNTVVLIKTCEFGHHWYSGDSCPLCDYLGREKLSAALGGEDKP